MASWYDYLPVVGAPIAALKGNYGQAITDTLGPLGIAAKDKITSANTTKTNGYYTASAQAQALADQDRQFQMQGLNQAEGYYAPAQAAINAAYGTATPAQPKTANPNFTLPTGVTSAVGTGTQSGWS